MNRCFPITRSSTNRPMTLPPASAFQARPACASTKLVADGKASFCASGTERYCTAWAEELIETSAAAGAVHLVHSDIDYSLSIRGRPAGATSALLRLRSEEEPDAA